MHIIVILSDPLEILFPFELAFDLEEVGGGEDKLNFVAEERDAYQMLGF